MKTKSKPKITQWQKLKRSSPRVPNITCPDIDAVLARVEEHTPAGADGLTQRDWQFIKRRMEQLRKANEQLRDSSQYWYDVAKKHIQGVT